MITGGWTTVSVMPSTGWSNVFRQDGRETGVPSPAILLQQASGGQTRAVFAAIARGGELVPAVDVPGYVRTLSSETLALQQSPHAGY